MQQVGAAGRFAQETLDSGAGQAAVCADCVELIDQRRFVEYREVVWRARRDIDMSRLCDLSRTRVGGERSEFIESSVRKLLLG